MVHDLALHAVGRGLPFRIRLPTPLFSPKQTLWAVSNLGRGEGDSPARERDDDP